MVRTEELVVSALVDATEMFIYAGTYPHLSGKKGSTKNVKSTRCNVDNFDVSKYKIGFTTGSLMCIHDSRRSFSLVD
jgi:hypothetical protein